MKRITNYLIAMALMAFTFTSCEDVPNPFGQILPPGGGDDVVVIDPAGSGTQADPYNVQAIINIVSALDASTTLEKEYYVKGIVTNIPEGDKGISTSYNNATFYISDDADGNNSFYIYRCLGLGGGDITDANFIKVGDEVVIHGTSWVNYQGNTPETTQKTAYVYSINGKTEGGGGGETPSGEAKGTGTQADPFNAAAANKYIATLTADTESENEIYIKGKLVKYANNGEFNAQYGNASFYLSDDGTESSEQFYVFRTLYLGNVKYTEGDTPKVGDEIVICGKVVNYKGNTPETVANKSYIYSLNGQTSGGGSDTPAEAGTLEKPFTPAEANAFIATLTADTNTDKDYYIMGKIIEITDKNQFSTQYGNCTFYLSDDGTDKDAKFYVFRTYYLGNQKYTDDSWAKPKAGDEVIICGKLVNYKGNTPETVANQSYIYSLNGQTTIGGSDTPAEAGTLEKPFTPAEANAFVAALAADTNTDKDYYIKGKIIEITDKNQFSTQYGNCTFYLSDDGTDKDAKFYVFRTYYLGNQKYTDDSWAKPKAGDEVIICGKLVNYKGNTPETVANQSYIYSLNGKTE